MSTEHKEQTKSVTELCVFTRPVSVVDQISRTARYAADPRKYLIETIGQAEYNRKKDSLIISPAFEKDLYGTGKQKQSFEQGIAVLLGKKHALFYLTGVQAQLSALRMHCDERKRYKVAWSINAHLESAEEQSFEQLYGLERTIFGDSPDELPTSAQIQALVSQSVEARPAAVLLEVPDRTLGCLSYDFAELERISKLCREHNVALHLDGARLWEIMPWYEAAGHTMVELCALFDTVYVSLYKGIGGVAGAILAVNSVHELGLAKMWQRRSGGNPVTMLYETIDCERAFNENFGTFKRRWAKMCEVVSAIQAATSEYLAGGQPVVGFRPDRPLCCQIRTVFRGFTAEELASARDRVEALSSIRVFNFIWPKGTLDEKLAADRRLLLNPALEIVKDLDTRCHEIEWSIMDVTEEIATEVFVKGYVLLCQTLTNTL